MKRLMLIALTLAVVAGFAVPANAISTDGYKFGAGVQGMNDHWGASFMWDIGPRGRTAIQPVLLVNDDIGVAGRLRYAFYNPRWVDFYAGGMLGVHGDLFFGGMAGVDWLIRGLDRQLPPISVSVEFSLTADENNTTMGLGAGIHWNFGR
jgi:opacity protein-like surface antigen